MQNIYKKIGNELTFEKYKIICEDLCCCAE